MTFHVMLGSKNVLYSRANVNPISKCLRLQKKNGRQKGKEGKDGGSGAPGCEEARGQARGQPSLLWFSGRARITGGWRCERTG